MTREEAINKVRQMSLPKETMEILQALTPELRESEDERIRKNLIELLLDTPAQDIISHNLELSKVLAYLEKQKEQKPECDNETEVQKAYREGKNAGRKEVLDHPEYYGLQLRRMYDYETGERNPEWSEEDEQIYNSFKTICEILIKNPHGEKFEADTVYVEKMLSWLKSLRPQPHWKPSEVQMEALAWYSGNSGIPPTGDKAIKSLYNDLKKL